MKHVSSCPGLQGSCAFSILTRLLKPPKPSATASQHPQLICTLSTTVSSHCDLPQWVKPEKKSGTMIHEWMNTYFDILHPILCSRGSPCIAACYWCPRACSVKAPRFLLYQTKPNKLRIWKEYINISELLAIIPKLIHYKSSVYLTKVSNKPTTTFLDYPSIPVIYWLYREGASVGSEGKESTWNVGDLGLIPGSESSLRKEWNAHPLQYFLPFHGQRSLGL